MDATSSNYFVTLFCFNFFDPRYGGSTIYVYNFLVIKVLKKKFEKIEDIFSSKIGNPTSVKISSFYNDKPFPNYKEKENLSSFLDTGNKNIFIKSLKDYIGMGKKILEVGCGTGQVANYLAAQTNNDVWGLDLGINSLKLAKNFAEENLIHNATYVHGDLFDDIFKEEKFDVIYCSGVLHHTNMPRQGFEKLVKLLKPGGIIIIGLYNWYGRFWTVLKSKLLQFSLFKNYGWIVDLKLRNFKNNKAKYEAWYQDQFQHPVESRHTFCELLEWFDSKQIKLLFSLPSTTLNENIDFDNFQERSNKFIRLFKQVLMLFQHYGREGGLFIFVGKK